MATIESALSNVVRATPSAAPAAGPYTVTAVRFESEGAFTGAGASVHYLGVGPSGGSHWALTNVTTIDGDGTGALTDSTGGSWTTASSPKWWRAELTTPTAISVGDEVGARIWHDGAANNFTPGRCVLETDGGEIHLYLSTWPNNVEQAFTVPALPTEAQAYSALRLTVYDANGGTFTSTREIEAYESSGGTNVLLAATKTITSSGDYAGYPKEYAFDGIYSETNGWRPTEMRGGWVRVDVAAPITPVEYAVGAAATGYATTERSMSWWRIEGSSDGGATWDVLDTRYGQAWDAVVDLNAPRVYALTPAAYGE